MAGEIATNEGEFDAFVKEKLDNREYSKSARRISESEAKAILDRLYGENRKKAIQETMAEWRSLSLRVRVWLQGDLGVKKDGKFGPEVRDALLRRERGEYDEKGKISYFGEHSGEHREGDGVEYREDGTAIGRFFEKIQRGMLFFKGIYALPKSVQNTGWVHDAMKTAAFDGVVFQGDFDSEGNPQSGTFFMASSRNAVCAIQDGKVCKPGESNEIGILTEEERRGLGDLFARAEKLRTQENEITEA